jgi:thiol-disulfide isomerase/thioredoxin
MTQRILLTKIFNLIEMKKITIYNLVVFTLILVGISISIGLRAQENQKSVTSFGELISEHEVSDILNTMNQSNQPSEPWGIYRDGETIYISCNNSDTYHKYDLNGNYQGSFATDCPNSALRDLGYDGEYTYGSWHDADVSKMDLSNETWVEILDFPAATMAVACDVDNNIFYTYGERNSGYDNPISVVDENLNKLYQFNISQDRQYSGLAFDPQGPYLWGFCRNSDNKCTLVQMALPSGDETGVEIDMSTILTSWTGSSDHAGGIEIIYDEDTQQYIMYGILRNKCFWSLDITEELQTQIDIEALSIASPLSGFDLENDETLTIRIKNNSNQAVTNIAVEVQVGADEFSATINETIEGGGYYDYTFSETVDVSSFNNYDFMISVDHPDDINNDNNTVINTVSNIEPYYYIPYGYCSYGDGVYSFQLADINNPGTGCGGDGYSDFTNMHTNLLRGNTYDVTVTTDGPTQYTSLWIDFNDDKIFSTDELLATNIEMPSYGTATFPIEIPSDANMGYLRLRVSTQWHPETPAGPNAQTDIAYGEAEDYMVTISDDEIAADVAVLEIHTPRTSYPVQISPTATIKNHGSETQSFTTTMSIGTYNSSIMVSDLTPGEQREIEFDVWNPEVGMYNIEVCTELEGDELPQNNCTEKEIFIRSQDKDMVVLEMGTATWCGFCPGAAMGAEDLVDNNHNVGVIEYHGNDSYANTASNNRINYYDITGFPTAVFDGLTSYVGGGSSSIYSTYLPIYEDCMEIPTSYKMIFLLDQVEDDTYKASISINKIDNINDDNLVLHLAVTQSNIEENWMGMSELHYVARMMVPDNNGTTLDFNGGNTQNVELEFNMPYPIEDCELVAFVQNSNTKEIFQSAKVSFNETAIYDTDVDDNIMLYPMPATDVLNIKTDRVLKVIEIYNSNGVKVQSLDCNHIEVTRVIDVSMLSTGLYHMVIIDEFGSIHTRKFNKINP